MGDLVYAASCSGVLYALDIASGEVRWSYDTAQEGKSAEFHGDPVVTDELLVIPSDSPTGHVYAFETQTGAVRWKTAVPPNGLPSDLVRFGSTVVGASTAGELLAFDLETGEVRWRLPTGTEGSPGSRRYAPALDGERLYDCAADGVVRAIDAGSGEVLWSRDLDLRFNTAPIVHDGHLVIGAKDRRLYRLRLTDGEPTVVLELPGPPTGTPSIVDGAIVLPLTSGFIIAAEADLSSLRWSHGAASLWSSLRPLVGGGLAVAGTDEGELVAVRLDDGAAEWQRQLEGTIRGIGRAGDALYVGTLGGTLYALDANPTAASGSPAIAAAVAPASDGGETAASAFAPLAFMAGTWRGEKGGSSIEEIWRPPDGDNMIGMFRLVADGSVVFYEFMSIEAEASGPVLRIKHFDKGLVGWEEKERSVVFDLARVGDGEAVFEERPPGGPARLIYRLAGPDELVLVLEKEKDGKTSRSGFQFTRER